MSLARQAAGAAEEAHVLNERVEAGRLRLEHRVDQHGQKVVG